MAVTPSSTAALRTAFETKRLQTNAALSKTYGKDIKLGVEERDGRLIANVYVDTEENERLGDAFASRLLDGAMATLNIDGMKPGSVKAARDGRFVKQAIDFSEL